MSQNIHPFPSNRRIQYFNEIRKKAEKCVHEWSKLKQKPKILPTRKSERT